MTTINRTDPCYQAKHEGYLDAINFIIARKDDPTLPWPKCYYHPLYDAENCMAWTKSFMETMERKGSQ